MLGTVSFHPIDLRVVDELLQPLIAGSRVNPESYVNEALRLQRSAWFSDCCVRTLEDLLERTVPPPPPEDGTWWDRVRTRLERFDFQPDPLGVLVAERIDPDLHLVGRPFFITESSADRVAEVVDAYRQAEHAAEVRDLVSQQLARLDRRLGSEVEPTGDTPPADLVTRRGLLESLRVLRGLARRIDPEAAGRATQPAAGQGTVAELAWRTVVAASRSMPFWTARNVDGLETVCRAADVGTPACLAPAWRLFGDTWDAIPGLAEALGTELSGPASVGGFVEPDRVADLLEFLNSEGSRIIQAASRAGEGPACTTLLRKIRECARYAEAHGLAYLEASGIPPLFAPE